MNETTLSSRLITLLQLAAENAQTSRTLAMLLDRASRPEIPEPAVLPGLVLVTALDYSQSHLDIFQQGTEEMFQNLFQSQPSDSQMTEAVDLLLSTIPEFTTTFCQSCQLPLLPKERILAWDHTDESYIHLHHYNCALAREDFATLAAEFCERVVAADLAKYGSQCRDSGSVFAIVPTPSDEWQICYVLFKASGTIVSFDADRADQWTQNFVSFHHANTSKESSLIMNSRNDFQKLFGRDFA